MNADQFSAFWQATYPAAGPLSYRFRHTYPERWLRIHSLPAGQRYPNSSQDWQVLLARQNAVLAELLSPGEAVLLLTGEYDFAAVRSLVPWQYHPPMALQTLCFTTLPSFPLVQLAPDPHDASGYEPNDLFHPVLAQISWRLGGWDALLREMALDEWRAFFVVPAQPLLIAPYDGGLDLVFPDSATRERYKAHFAVWLSPHPAGV
jgi:hypothetical protein